MIAGRADGREVNDLVTVRPLTRPGTSPRWVAEQTFGVWLGWGLSSGKQPRRRATPHKVRETLRRETRGRAGGYDGSPVFPLDSPLAPSPSPRPCSATHRRRFSIGGNSTTASGGQDPSADPRRRQPAGQPGVRPRYGGKVHQAGPSPVKPSFRGSIGTRWPVGGALEVGRVSCEGQLFRRSTRSRDSPAAPPGWSDSSASAKRVAGKAVLRAAQI